MNNSFCVTVFQTANHAIFDLDKADFISLICSVTVLSPSTHGLPTLTSKCVITTCKKKTRKKKYRYRMNDH